MLRVGDLFGPLRPGSCGAPAWARWFDAQPGAEQPPPVAAPGHRQPLGESASLLAQGPPALVLAGVPRNYHLVPRTDLTEPIE
jgi:hypothetical protein